MSMISRNNKIAMANAAVANGLPGSTIGSVAISEIIIVTTSSDLAQVRQFDVFPSLEDIIRQIHTLWRF